MKKILLSLVFITTIITSGFSQASRLWATYYGGADWEEGTSVATDRLGNVYVTGWTYSTTGIASGGFQNTFGGGVDAFLVKFDASGNRLWATYYGGSGNEEGYDVTTDTAGNVYLCGYTTSSTGIASGGFQNTYGGGTSDGFLIKFNASGGRIWGTYYGGTGEDVSQGVTIDKAGNILLVGDTRSTTNIASGGFQNSPGGGGLHDAYLVKFNSAGARTWSTYYGGPANDSGYGIASDTSGNIFISGISRSTTSIASGGFQGTFGGIDDAFLVKFNSSGSRLWATYYGGTSQEYGYSIATDITGNVYLAGETWSNTSISSGGFQNTYGGSADAFIAKFNSSGNRIWATYYGGSGSERGHSIAIDMQSNLYLAGLTSSTSAVASGGFQNTFTGGGWDAFVASFDSSGNRLCATYYGETNGTISHCAVDKFNNVYLTSETDQTTGLASGGFQNTYGGGGYDAFLVKFTSCTLPLSSSTSSTDLLCNGECIGTATANPAGGSGAYTYSWNTLPVQTTQTATGLCANTYSVAVTDALSNLVTLTVTITEPSILSSTVTSNNINCYGLNNGSATINATGGTSPYSYSWSNSSTAQIISNLSTGSYSCTITDVNGCSSIENITLTEPAILSATIIGVDALCYGSTGVANLNASGGTPGYTFLWNNGQTSSSISNLTANTYTCAISDNNGCTTLKTISITQPSAITMTLSSTPSQCINNTGTANASANGGTPGYTFLWSDGQTTQVATGLAYGSATVTITDANGCTQNQSANVNQTPSPNASATANPLTVIKGTNTSLLASGGINYLWSPSDGLACSTCANTTAEIFQSTTYCVFVTDSNGCTDSSCVSIDVECGNIFIPTAFSPNGDGQNETECILGNCLESVEFTIYDRWGEAVFTTTNPDICWDGIYNNKPVEASTLTYSLKATLQNGTRIVKKGTISLIR